jgi:ABC-type proline/glycine betaine transport system permease subunit
VTVAALIGGGGFGVFIFQGLGQTAMDLVLLGAVPTVFFAFSSAVILDAVADSIRGSCRMSMIEIRNVTKRYGATVVDNVSMSRREG